MYKTILVPHAGTSEGDIALRHAIHIAKSSSAKIILLHVIEEFPQVPLGFALHSSQITKIRKQIAEMTREMKITMEKQMTARLELCKKHGDTSLKIIAGLPAEEILKIVKNQKIDLIVMAKRRKLKGFKRLLMLGSVSRKIVENTSCPVLLIDVEKKR